MNPDHQPLIPETQISPPGERPESVPDGPFVLSRQSEAAAEPLPAENNAAENRHLTPTLRSTATEDGSNEEERESTTDTNGSPHSNCRRNGNVARLPKVIRDKINVMIQDGVPYPAIIERLGEYGKGLSSSNLTHWKNGGYKDWVLEQSWLAETRAKQESASDVADFDGTQVNHAALQLGALHIFEALRKLGPGTLNEKLGGDSAAFARLINALARASKETLQLQKHRESCAKARAALESLRDPKRKLTEEERRSLVLVVDDILGLPRQREREMTEANNPVTNDQ